MMMMIAVYMPIDKWKLNCRQLFFAELGRKLNRKNKKAINTFLSLFN